MVWQDGDINQIRESLYASLINQFQNRFNPELYQKAQTVLLPVPENEGKKLTYLPMPENPTESTSVQLGLFDTAPAEQINRAMAYINPLDETVVQKASARIIGAIRTTDKPSHENVVLLTAKQHKSNRFLYSFILMSKR
ncbi:hypothetical protein KRR40_05190 [Niabella defluvii]|nr:hypothetical protein KRR40_05190 [Niabella sp. I65]